jgi:ribosome biogenesis ATPase
MESSAVDYNKRLRETYSHNKTLSERERAVCANSKHKIEDLGGVEKQIERALQVIRMPLEHARYYKMVGVEAAKGVLVHGPSGSGKTVFVHAIAAHCRLPLLKVSPAEVGGKLRAETIKSIFRKAEEMRPAIIFVDEVDTLCGKRGSPETDSEKSMSAELCSAMDDLAGGVVVVGASADPEAIDPSLRRSGRMSSEVRMCVPVEAERVDILRKLVSKIEHTDIDLQYIAKHTPGYVGADLQALVAEAGQICVRRGLVEIGRIRGGVGQASAEVTVEMHRDESEVFSVEERDFEAALKVVQPSAKKEGFVVIPDVTFEDIGALEDVKRVLEMSIIKPSLYPEKFRRVGIQRPSGVLLHGPPGCGKTMLAKAIASKSHCNFISVKGPELISMYVGESERAIRKVFSRARFSQPCVIFFDEIDSICAKRGGTSKYGDTLVNQLLVEMDGLEERGEVYLIGATNRIDIIDKALLRPGRFDNVVEIPPPTREEAVEIFAKKTCNVSVEAGVDPESLGLEGFTGAEIEMIVREAGSMCLQENFDSDAPVIGTRHFLEAREKVLSNRNR